MQESIIVEPSMMDSIEMQLPISLMLKDSKIIRFISLINILNEEQLIFNNLEPNMKIFTF